MTEAPSLEERVASLEEAIKRLEVAVECIQSDCSEVLRTQSEGKKALLDSQAESRRALQKEGAAIRKDLLEQSAAVLAVSQSMIKLQTSIGRWGAAGTLAGAVLLYIITRVAGL